MKSRIFSTKSIGRLFLTIPAIASTPLPNMFYYGCITFESPQIANILDFKGIRDRTGYHIAYKESSQIHSKTSSLITLMILCWKPNDVYLLGHH